MIDKQLIADVAAVHGLPVSLVEAVIMVESGGNPWAVRYEPAFLSRYVSGKNHPRYGACSRATEEQGLAHSWGLMQVMGLTAREEGFMEPFLSQLCEPRTGMDVGCRHLARLARHFPASTGYGWDAVCAAYNGGRGVVRSPKDFRNPEYPAKVCKILGGAWPKRMGA